MRSVVIVCTRHRPDEVLGCMDALVPQLRPSREILVVDSSLDRQTELALATYPHKIAYARCEPGLARQRNAGLTRLDDDVEIVHFVDDDARVAPDYLDEVERFFLQNPSVAGVGPVIAEQVDAAFKPIKRVFGLYSTRRGVVLPSGRNTHGQAPGGPFPRDVQWLGGCAMSYRLSAIRAHQFDERLAYYSLGEDADFGYRLYKAGRRLVAIDSTCTHHELSPVDRLAARDLSWLRMHVLHSWVVENRALGLSLAAFWWAAMGEILLNLVDAFVRPRRRSLALATARGTLEGWRDIARHGSRRDAWRVR